MWISGRPSIGDDTRDGISSCVTDGGAISSSIGWVGFAGGAGDTTGLARTEDVGGSEDATETEASVRSGLAGNGLVGSGFGSKGFSATGGASVSSAGMSIRASHTGHRIRRPTYFFGTFRRWPEGHDTTKGNVISRRRTSSRLLSSLLTREVRVKLDV